jgi:hypothetical protein
MKGKQRRYTIRQILTWADQYHELTGRWPTSRTGAIWGADATWEAINTALRKGLCGLPGGDSLARVLQRHRRAIDPRLKRPEITRKQILEWADAHHSRTGHWPTRESGRVAEAPDITWATINRHLQRGGSNLAGSSSLLKLLREARGAWDSRGSRRLSVQLILKWAQHHHMLTGRWPVTKSGPVLSAPGELWVNIDVAMRNGRRGFPLRQSLSQLLQEHFGETYARGIGRRQRPNGQKSVRTVKLTRVEGAVVD